MVRPALSLSLQFARDELVRAHRNSLPRAKVARWIRAALQHPAEITVRIVGLEEGQALNRDYRNNDHATNVLTFDYSHAPVVAREAAEACITLQAHYAHLLVHGTLHAQGHDHQSDAEATAMESIETGIVVGLGFADPYRR